MALTLAWSLVSMVVAADADPSPRWIWLTEPKPKQQAIAEILSGTLIKSEGVTVIGMVPPGHKVATRAIASGSPVRRYNQIIGFATRDIRPGEHVHLHNLGIGAEHGAFERDYAFCADVHPTPAVAAPASFMGIVRPDGRVATRNYIAILSARWLTNRQPAHRVVSP